jgi:hypothetical protein
MSLTYLVTKRAATVVPFSMAKTPLTGPLFYDHTQVLSRMISFKEEQAGQSRTSEKKIDFQKCVVYN